MKSEYFDNLIYYSLLIFIFLIPIILFPNQAEPTTFSRHLILALFVSVMFIIWIIKYAIFKETELKKSPLNLFIILYLILTIVSILQSTNKYESIFYISQLFSLTLLYYIVLNNLDSKKIKGISKIVLAVGFIVSVIGVFQFFEIGFLSIPSTAMPSSTFINRNIASMFLVLTIPLSLIIFFMTKKFINEVIFSFMISFQLFYMICTRTRAAWISLLTAFFISFIIVLIKNWSKSNLLNLVKKVVLNRKTYVVIISLIIVTITILQVKAKQNIWFKQSISQTHYSFINSEDPGRKHRMVLWNNTKELIEENWISGVGVGNWKFIYPLFAGVNNSLTLNFKTPHNDYLWIFSELGILGFLVYILILLSAIYICIKIYLRSEEKTKSILSIFLIFVISAYFVNSIFSFPKDRISSQVLFWISLAFISLLYYKNKEKKRIISGKKYIFVGLLIFICSIISITFSYRYLLLDHYYKNVVDYYNNNQWDEVIDKSEESEKYGSFYHKIHSFEGLAYLRKGKYEESINSFNKYLKYDPNYINVLLSLGYVYEDMRLNDKAIETFDRLLKIKPDLIDVRKRLGNIYLNDDIYDKAINEYNAILPFLKDSVETLSNIGVVFLLKNDFENAEKYFNKAISMDSSSVETINNLGFVYLSQSKFDNAIELFTKAIEIDPKYVVSYNNLSKAFISQGKYNSAKEVLMKALEIDPEYTDANNNLNYVNKVLSEQD